MTIDVAALRAWPFGEVSRSYDESDAILYALGLGIGQDPTDPMQLQFVYENGLMTLPTMGAILGFPGPFLSDPATGIDYSRVVHSEQHLETMRPLPVAATLRCVNRVIDVADRGREKGAAISVVRELYVADDGDLISRLTSVLIARNDGGFDEIPSAAPPLRSPPMPDREADVLFEWRVPPHQALLYRLSGDRNPLHVDPATARRAGFDRPILHGLASFGIAGFVLIVALCNGDPTALRELGVRFSAPIIPGDTLAFKIWRTERGAAAFQARAIERDKTVLTGGRVRYADEE